MPESGNTGLLHVVLLPSRKARQLIVMRCRFAFVYMYVCMYVCIKTPPAQVAQCQDHLGHKYRSGMQQPNAGSTRARSALRWCRCASCIWLLHPAPILVPKMVLTLCNLRWWCFFFHQLAKILHLQSWSLSPAATCAGGVFHSSN